MNGEFFMWRQVEEYKAGSSNKSKTLLVANKGVHTHRRSHVPSE
jgi:hypothetical protein